MQNKLISGVTNAAQSPVIAPCSCDAVEIFENASPGTQVYSVQYADFLSGQKVGDPATVGPAGTHFTFYAQHGQPFIAGQTVGFVQNVTSATATAYVATPRRI